MPKIILLITCKFKSIYRASYYRFFILLSFILLSFILLSYLPGILINMYIFKMTFNFKTCSKKILTVN